MFAKPFEIALEDLVERLKIEGGDVEFLSKKVFVADDKDTPEGELPSLESMFSDVKWEEMAEVTTKEYQVETQTGTAGVRG